MVAAASPTVWRRWLALELRRLREERGLSQRDVGRSCGWSGARLSYLENAQQNVVDDDLDALLPLYEVSDSRQAWFYEAAALSHEQGWWERWDAQRDPWGAPNWFSAFVGLEQGASEDRNFEVVVVPGLLQTAGYAAAVLAADVVPRTKQQVDRLVELRLSRQEALTRSKNPLNLSVVVDEAAIHRRTKDLSVMAAQLDHLVTMAELPNVTFQVLPFGQGVYPYTFGAFHILTFPYSGDSGLVWVEHGAGAMFLERQYQVDRYALMYQHLSSQLALPPDESVAVVRNVAKEFRARTR